MDGFESQHLVRELRRAAASRLHELLAMHAESFGPLHVRQMLLNPFCSAEHIEAVAVKRRLMAMYTVRVAVVRHRKTPQVLALSLLPDLFWRDLMEVHLDKRLHTSVRRAAENYLIKRLSRLAVGEKIALGRRAEGAILDHLYLDPNPRVIQAMLENPRLGEPTLLRLLSHREVTPRILDLVAASPRWGRRYAVRVALCRHPMTPFRVVFDLLPGLQRRDLEQLGAIEDLSSVVHRRAEALIREKTPRRKADPH